MSHFSKIVQWIKKQRPLRWFYIGGVILLIGAGLLWWFKVQTQPERVFEGMLEQSLSTNGVTMQSSQDSNGSKIDYTLQYSFGAENRARSLTVVEQPGAKVTTEMIGTDQADFTRYRNIETSQNDAEGNPLDVSAIENVWAKTADGQNSLLGQSVFGLNLPLGALPVPIANLEPEDRQKLLDQMGSENVYEVDYENVEKTRQDGRLHYTYEVSIQMILYAHLMKEFASSLGLHEFDELDPNTYSGAEPMKLKMTVDVRSSHLVSVNVPGQNNNPAYSQTFSGYDVPVGVDLPEETITSTELQRRLQEL